MMEKVWDVIIIGGGPAGLTAGLYSARHGHSTLILDGRKIGGRALEAHMIENYPGFPQGITGSKLMNLFREQAYKFGVAFGEETVISISDLGDLKMVSTRQGYYQAKTIILATGVQRKQLSVPGETEFKGRGVSYCSICDGPFFKDKTVAVVGSGHEAVIDALHLADSSSKVYAIPGSKGYSEEYAELEKLRSSPKIEVIEGAEVAEIKGEEFVTHLLMNGGRSNRINVDGVFIILEHISTWDIFSEAGIKTDEGGCVKVDEMQRTSIPGVFAAGDCSCIGWQIIAAAGDGAKAALSAMKYIKQRT